MSSEVTDGDSRASSTKNETQSPSPATSVLTAPGAEKVAGGSTVGNIFAHLSRPPHSTPTVKNPFSFPTPARLPTIPPNETNSSGTKPPRKILPLKKSKFGASDSPKPVPMVVPALFEFTMSNKDFDSKIDWRLTRQITVIDDGSGDNPALFYPMPSSIESYDPPQFEATPSSADSPPWIPAAAVTSWSPPFEPLDTFGDAPASPQSLDHVMDENPDNNGETLETSTESAAAFRRPVPNLSSEAMEVMIEDIKAMNAATILAINEAHQAETNELRNHVTLLDLRNQTEKKEMEEALSAMTIHATGAFDSKCRELEAAYGKYSDLEALYDNLQSSLDRFVEMDNSEANAQKIQQQEDDIIRCKTANEELEKQVKWLSSNNEISENRIKELQEYLKNTHEQFQNLKLSNKNLHDNWQRAQNSVIEIQRRCDAYERAKSTAEGRTKTVLEAQHKTEAQLASMQFERDARVQQVKEFHDMSKRNEELINELRNENASLKAYSTSYDQVLHERDGFQEDVIGLREQLSNLRGKNESDFAPKSNTFLHTPGVDRSDVCNEEVVSTEEQAEKTESALQNSLASELAELGEDSISTISSEDEFHGTEHLRHMSTYADSFTQTESAPSPRLNVLSLVGAQNIVPGALPEEDLNLSPIRSEHTTPIAQSSQILKFSELRSEKITPVPSPRQMLTFSRIQSESTAPVTQALQISTERNPQSEKVDRIVPAQQTLSFSPIQSQSISPISPPQDAFNYTSAVSQNTTPTLVQQQNTGFQAHQARRAAKSPEKSPLVASTVMSQNIAPISPPRLELSLSNNKSTRRSLPPSLADNSKDLLLRRTTLTRSGVYVVASIEPNVETSDTPKVVEITDNTKDITNNLRGSDDAQAPENNPTPEPLVSTVVVDRIVYQPYHVSNHSAIKCWFTTEQQVARLFIAGLSGAFSQRSTLGRNSPDVQTANEITIPSNDGIEMVNGTDGSMNGNGVVNKATTEKALHVGNKVLRAPALDMLAKISASEHPSDGSVSKDNDTEDSPITVIHDVIDNGQLDLNHATAEDENPFSTFESDEIKSRDRRLSNASTSANLQFDEYIHKNPLQILFNFFLHLIFYYLIYLCLSTITVRSAWLHVNEHTHSLVSDLLAYRRNVHSSPGHLEVSSYVPERWSKGLLMGAMSAAEGMQYEFSGYRMPG